MLLVLDPPTAFQHDEDPESDDCGKRHGRFRTIFYENRPIPTAESTTFPGRIVQPAPPGPQRSLVAVSNEPECASGWQANFRMPVASVTLAKRERKKAET